MSDEAKCECGESRVSAVRQITEERLPAPPAAPDAIVKDQRGPRVQTYEVTCAGCGRTRQSTTGHPDA